jgi:hypothetical protein
MGPELSKKDYIAITILSIVFSSIVVFIPFIVRILVNRISNFLF